MLIYGRRFYTSDSIERRLAIVHGVFLCEISGLHLFESFVDVFHDGLLHRVEFRRNDASLSAFVLFFLFGSEVVDLVFEGAITFNG